MLPSYRQIRAKQLPTRSTVLFLETISSATHQDSAIEWKLTFNVCSPEIASRRVLKSNHELSIGLHSLAVSSGPFPRADHIYWKSRQGVSETGLATWQHTNANCLLNTTIRSIASRSSTPRTHFEIDSHFRAFNKEKLPSFGDPENLVVTVRDL